MDKSTNITLFNTRDCLFLFFFYSKKNAANAFIFVNYVVPRYKDKEMVKNTIEKIA